ncbi:MAG: OsmC family protein [Alphaproteobacteria bacterium]|nr:OsmC family protein [Alphaproteobacteria bacterium]
MKIRPKTIWSMTLDGTGDTPTKTTVRSRDLTVTMDEPKDRGGTNLGMMPLETMMAGLIGCTNVVSHKIANANDIDIEDMSVRAEVTVNSSGTRLVKEIDVPFPEIRLYIEFTTASDRAAVDILKRDLRRYCAVSKVLQQAGSKVEEIWTIHHR